jgi:uncharacterized protein (DUF4415 family)
MKIKATRVDLANLPPLTAQQLAELQSLAGLPDSAIDVSDIPPLTADFWQHAVRSPFYRPTKTATTVRIDSDVLLWIKAKGKGYQTRINAILRKTMIEEIKKARP